MANHARVLQESQQAVPRKIRGGFKRWAQHKPEAYQLEF
jgi:hypothetical protein